MANWYVSQKVGSSGAGTSLAVAKKTIAEAITAAATNGDTIYIYEGIYNEAITTKGNLKFYAVGRVVLDGGFSLPTGITYGTSSTSEIKGFLIRNFTNYQVSCVDFSDAKRLQLFNNEIIGNVYHSAHYYDAYLKGNIIKGDYIVRPYTGAGKPNVTRFSCYENNTFYGNCDMCCQGNLGYSNKKNQFKSGSNLRILNAANTLASSHLIYCNFESTINITFQDTTNTPTYAAITSVATLKAKFTTDKSLTAELNQFDSCIFQNVTYNNLNKNNLTLDYSNISAYSNFTGDAIGAYQASANIICKATASSGNCDIYDISADSYSLGIFGGKSNVGAIDNANEKLYRTSDGANNWGVFVASTDLPRSHIIKNLRMFGTIIDRNGGQVSKNPGDFAYNYRIDVLVKWSATLSKAALLADTTIPFVRFRLRGNTEFNYYVNNSGTLVGDGESTYLGLVNSSDGGSGSLAPQKIVGKSFVAIIILQDA